MSVVFGILGFLAIVFVLFWLQIAVVQWGWNGVMPDMFGFKPITFSQSACMYFLASCLFKGSLAGYNKKEN